MSSFSEKKSHSLTGIDLVYCSYKKTKIALHEKVCNAIPNFESVDRLIARYKLQSFASNHFCISTNLVSIVYLLLSHPSQFIVIVACSTVIRNLNVVFPAFHISDCGRMNIIRRICRVSCSTMTTRILSLF